MVSTTQFRRFKLDRTGENVLHGTAMLSLIPTALGDDYKLTLGEAVSWDQLEEFEMYALVYPSFFQSGYVPFEEAFCGFAVGEVEHKMVKEHSPDISAIGLEAVDFPHPMVEPSDEEP